jgi:hypothetical protein
MLTYEETRPWAAAMKEAVLRHKMPPWFADPHYGKFSNANELKQSEIDTIAAWAAAKAPKGDPKGMPKPVDWVEGWQIGKPDLVMRLPMPFDVPVSGVVDYEHIIVPTGFTRDMWVQAAEVRPTHRAVVHHIIAFVREPQSNWFRGEKPEQFFIAPQVKTKEQPDTSSLPSDFLVGYAPGQPAEILRPVRRSSSRPVPILFFRSTTRRMERPRRIRPSSVLFLRKSLRNSACSLCLRQMARSRFRLAIRITASMPVSKWEHKWNSRDFTRICTDEEKIFYTGSYIPPANLKLS